MRAEEMESESSQLHKVVIIGGGFGGLYAALSLKRAPVEVTLIDKRNFHLFQPLLYQVATGALSPADIAAPLRGILKKQRNTHVILAKAVNIDPEKHTVILNDGEVGYDTLIVASGSQPHYFSHADWEILAPGLKSIEDATEMRRRILIQFEAAERETDPETIEKLLTFVVVGGGPTGVELAGALSEISRDTLRKDFRTIDPSRAKIILVEAEDQILSLYPKRLSEIAHSDLTKLGVVVKTKSLVAEIESDYVIISAGNMTEKIPTHCVLWAAGVKASPLGTILAKLSGTQLDRSGRVTVDSDLGLIGHPEILVLGDLANFTAHDGNSLPGLAPVAMQEGKYAANLIINRLRGRHTPPFHYRDFGKMATIGRSKAVAEIRGLEIGGLFGWLLWLFVHLMYIVEFESRILVLIQWAWNYFTGNRSARLITGNIEFPLFDQNKYRDSNYESNREVGRQIDHKNLK